MKNKNYYNLMDLSLNYVRNTNKLHIFGQRGRKLAVLDCSNYLHIADVFIKWLEEERRIELTEGEIEILERLDPLYKFIWRDKEHHICFSSHTVTWHDGDFIGSGGWTEIGGEVLDRMFKDIRVGECYWVKQLLEWNTER